jgi:hypothetical protein
MAAGFEASALNLTPLAAFSRDVIPDGSARATAAFVGAGAVRRFEGLRVSLNLRARPLRMKAVAGWLLACQFKPSAWGGISHSDLLSIRFIQANHTYVRVETYRLTSS